MASPSFALRTGRVVRLGRKAPVMGKRIAKLGHYLKAPGEGKPHPTAVDYFSMARASIAEMLGNDREGDCVAADIGHAFGVWTANDPDSGGEIVPTTAEVLKLYHDIGGPGDNGLVISEALDYVRDHGATLGGKLVKIADYVSVDPANRHQLETGTILFGGLTLGVKVYDSMFQTPDGGVWDAPSGRYRGDHDVLGCGYDPRGLVVSTWGGLRVCTWRFLASARTCDEALIKLAPAWTNDDRLSPAGVNVAGLVEALAVLRAGGDPSIDPSPVPTPPPPSPQPDGPAPVWLVDLVASAAAPGSPPMYRLAGKVEPPAALVARLPTTCTCGLLAVGMTWQQWLQIIIQILLAIAPLISAGKGEREILAWLKAHHPHLWERG